MFPFHRFSLAPTFLAVILILIGCPGICVAETYECPEGYTCENADNEHWCFKPHRSDNQLHFEGAIEECDELGDTLPILTSVKVNGDIADRITSGDYVWIGIICDEDTENWKWQDGQSLQFTSFDKQPPANCSESEETRFALRKDGKWRSYGKGLMLDYALCTRRATPAPSFPAWAIALIVVSVIVICLIITAIMLICRRRIMSLKAENIKAELEKQAASSSSVLQAQSLRYYNLERQGDEWEIERRFVGIDYMSKIGEGAFGSVYLGRVLAKNIPAGIGRSIVELSELKNNNDTVAVKKLHENADTLTEREFLNEIALMKSIGYHERLVNILACVTISAPILLVAEYCPNGDLLEFMRRRRAHMLEYAEDFDEGNIITVKKQLMFAIQIAYGLEFLSSRSFIHRDIAARNILVDAQETCKIGDFGLCRAVGKEDDNYHSQGGKLPLKWMSPEAIDKYHFSIASDIWSFGILLFEIVTLGGTPYPNWPAAELLSRLKRGDRMERPDNCSDKLFEIMQQCWAELPAHRPSFTVLRKNLGVLYENINQDNYYISLNADSDYYVFQSSES